MIVIPFLLLLPTVLANSVPFHHFVNTSCPNLQRPCTIILKAHTIYRTLSPTRFVGYPSVEITGGVESSICFDNGNHTRIFFGNITKVIVKNIQFNPCRHLAITHGPTSNPKTVAHSRGLSFHSISNLTILNSNFSDFHGVMVHVSDSRHVFVNNNKFESRSAFFSQGIFYTSSQDENSSLIVSESSFHGLVSWPGEGLENAERSHGAGIAIHAIDTTSTFAIKISHCKFTHCHATKGPALFLINENYPSSFNLVVEASIFSSNFASVTEDLFDHVCGGAIAIVSGVNKSEIDISHCHFHNNTAKIGNGGAISISSDTSSTSRSLVIRNSNFTENSAWMGGAISVVVVGSIFLPRDSLEISHCHFEKDSAGSGGAIFASHYNLSLKNKNVFSRNSAHISGGVFFARNSVIDFIGSNLIANNHAQIYGGAFYLGDRSKIIIANGNNVSNILGNTAGRKGGALYVDQRFMDINLRFTDHQCFIQSSQEYSTSRLVFEDNRVISGMRIRNVKPCLGNDIFSRTMAHCSHGSPLNDTLTLFQRKGIILNETGCSIGTEPSRIGFSFLPMCNISIKGREVKMIDCVEDSTANIDQEVYQNYFHKVRQRIKTKLESHRGEFREIDKMSLIFPGYYSKFRLELLDEFNQTTISDISLKFFEGIHSRTEFKNVSITPIPTPWIPTVEYNFTIAFERESENKFFFGRMCAEINSLNDTSQIHHCINIIVSNCPGWLFTFVKTDSTSSQYTCIPKFEKGLKNRYFSQLYEGTNDYTHIQTNPYKSRLIAIDNHEKTVRPVKCEFFNCKCNSWLVPRNNCNFNLLTPYDQCKPGLKGPYCTECKEKIQLPIPPVSILHGDRQSQCYTCWPPYIGIPLFFVLAIVATTIILSLRIDIFNDYTRSIAFYSSILYLYVLGCGQIGKDLLFQIISVFISISNLLITQNYPFCVSSDAHSKKKVAIFNEWSPFVFFFLIMVVYFLFSRVSFLQRYNIGKNIHFPMWTLFILSYCNLCVAAFVPFQCNSANRWIYDSNEKCHELGFLYIFSIVLVVILLLFPLILVVLSYRSRVRFIHITGNYENRFRYGFKLWEVMKLFCRFVFASIFILPYMLHNYSLDNCSYISIFSLLLLILNSLLQPATNRYANHFESFCLFVLAIIGIPAISQQGFWGNYLPSFLVLSPYFLFVLIKLSPIFKLSTKYLTCKKKQRT